MNADTFNALCVPLTLPWKQALTVMDDTAQGVLLAVDAQRRLVRTVTDGDLRRAVLGEVPAHYTLADLPRREPHVVHEDATAANVLALMDQHQIDHVPVLDATERPVDVVFRRELTQRIWLSSPHLGEEETAFVEEAFRTNWIAPLGPHVDAFERELAAEVGVGHAAALSSGTAAIHLALQLLGVQRGDTVFCSSLTFVGSCNPIRTAARSPFSSIPSPRPGTCHRRPWSGPSPGHRPRDSCRAA